MAAGSGEHSSSETADSEFAPGGRAAPQLPSAPPSRGRLHSGASFLTAVAAPQPHAAGRADARGQTAGSNTRGLHKRWQLACEACGQVRGRSCLQNHSDSSRSDSSPPVSAEAGCASTGGSVQPGKK